MSGTPALLSRRAALGAAAALSFAGAALAFPDRPVRLLVGFPPGTGPDLVARLLAEALREAWPAGMVVENRPGAAGQIAAQEAARAAPDGHTLLFGEVGQLAMAPSTYARLPYDPARDFAPVARIVTADFAFVVPAATPANDLEGYLAWARGRRQVFLGTFGAGTPGHFGAVMLGAAGGLNVEAVHFRATGEGMTALLGGDLQGMFGSVALVAPHVQAGRLKALATTGTRRAPLLPGVPTFGELGRPAMVFEAWFGVVAPAATPEPALAALETAILRALSGQGAQARLQEAGFAPAMQGRADFAALITTDRARWAEVVRSTGFRALE
jgi:tripartite-type tricarboxylate transporter receptor subunit TctC